MWYFSPPIRHGFAHGFVNYKKGCTRLAAASHKVYQLLAHGWWFSLGTPASSTTKTGRHDIDEIFLKVALNIKNQIKSIIYWWRKLQYLEKVNDLQQSLTNYNIITATKTDQKSLNRNGIQSQHKLSLLVFSGNHMKRKLNSDGHQFH